MKRHISFTFLMAGLLIGGMTGSAPAAESPPFDIVTEHTFAPAVLSMSAVKLETPPPAEDSFSPYPVPLSQDLQRFVYAECGEDPELFALCLALIDVESGCQPDVISPTGDYGLMQINEVNHGWLSDKLGITDFLDPYENIRAGMHMLGDIYEAQQGDIARTLMVYNLGQRGAKQLWKQGVASTHYTQKVLTRLQELKEYENEKGKL